MSNPAKAKGTAFESALVTRLHEFGIPARRVAQAGALDTGDVHGISPFAGQAKAYANLADGLRLGLNGAEVQRIRAGEDYGVAFAKRVRKPIGQCYAVTTVDTFAQILARLNRAEELLARAAPADYARHVNATAAASGVAR